MDIIKKYKFPIMMFIVFEAIAISLWLASDTMFMLFNFTYIGSSISIGLVLYIKGFKHARNVIQFCVGIYMLVLLGIIGRENMMIEGFWYYLFMGVFQAAVIHYAVAKIFGPFLFGRGWCGYACWSAMIFDLLPYKKPKEPPVNKLKIIRYIVFVVSFTFVLSLFIFKVENLETIMFWSFIIGNVLYYLVGIILAFVLKDNRAFCKYICPITVFLKATSYFSLLRVKVDERKCVSCSKCKKACPMNVDMTNNSRKRANGTECILCMTCINECHQKALHL